MNVLVLNAGSSSIKYRLFQMAEREVKASGRVERIGDARATARHVWSDGSGTHRDEQAAAPGHREALEHIMAALANQGLLRDSVDLFGIGHRVVHGGDEFSSPALVDEDVIEGIKKTIPLAPLHNPANLMGIQVARTVCPRVPQVAVFDTAFHQSLPSHASRYALPGWLHDRHGVRRYGFHGTSHSYVARRATGMLGRPPEDVNLITLHLGNGASATAIRGGQSVDTSMGLTPLEGLVMGTRSGDVDPALHFYLMRTAGMSPDEVESLLYSESGLKGLAGTNDLRDIEERARDGDPQAACAVDIYTYRIRKQIGAYLAVLGRVDALVFTGGIGEHSALVRARATDGLEPLGIVLNPEANARAGARERAVHARHSAVSILVVPTDEEGEIARLTVACIRSAQGPEGDSRAV